MSRLRCLGLGACLALSLTAMACGSSNSGGAGGASGWEQARIGNTGTGWWVNAQKGAFFFSAQIYPSESSDTTGRATVIDFVQKVVAKLTSGTPAPATLVPAANEVSGWALDPSSTFTANGPAVATSLAEATTLIDGGADPFFTSNYSASGMAWEVYAKDPYTIDLRVWQMGSTAAAKALYTGLLSNSLYSPDNIPWKTCMGTDSTNPCP